MTFFYQSWNHRRSTIPVDQSLWQKGVVTYPNAKDKTESAMHRAGHAIEIIGWDDDLEFPMRDEAGNPVLDANGNPKMEKGFWLFKNSWGTASFGIDHPYGAGYGWLSMQYVKEYGSAVVGELPMLGGTPPDMPMGATTHSYSATPGAAIPDANPTGASSTIEVSDAGTLAAVKVTTDITHTYKGDLEITLTHGTVTKTIFKREGASADDVKTTFTITELAGASLAGAWTLKVVDTAAQDVGTLNSWKLDVTTN
jgi:hypothetical protein